MDNLTGFAVALLTILIVPGPTNTLLATSGATVGLFRSLPLLIFELAGYETAIAAIRTWIVPTIARLPAETRVIRAVAAAYLITLAIGLWRWRLAQATRAVRAPHVFITTLLNPKALLIGLVLIPVTAQTAPTYWWVLTLMIPVVGAGWICFGHLANRATSQGLSRAIPRAASMILGTFALFLVVSVIR